MAQTAIEYKKVARIGKISIEQFRGSYRLRWTLSKKTYGLTIGPISKECLAIAKNKASQIDLDITLGCFDGTLIKYDNRRQIIAVAPDVLEYAHKLDKGNYDRKVELDTAFKVGTPKMTILRLTSIHSGTEFVITQRSLEGYSVDLINESLILYTEHYPINLQNTAKNQWDNWHEFVEQVKKRFTETNELC
jgi:hypothetical protein